MTSLTGVVVVTAGYDGSKSETAPQTSDSTDEDRLKVNVETWSVNVMDVGNRARLSALLGLCSTSLSKQMLAEQQSSIFSCLKAFK